MDYGSTNVEVEKAEGVDNILAVKATGAFTEDTNILRNMKKQEA